MLRHDIEDSASVIMESSSCAVDGAAAVKSNTRDRASKALFRMKETSETQCTMGGNASRAYGERRFGARTTEVGSRRSVGIVARVPMRSNPA